MPLMTALVKKTPSRGINIEQITIPDPGKEELLVEIICASICGTDVGIYNWIPWAQSHVRPPLVIGHEIVGRVIAINSHTSSSIKEGDYISSETHIYCGNCKQCNLGNKHICENLELFGITRNGGFADFATVPIRTSWKNDASLTQEMMSIQEPLGNAVHALSKVDIYGKRVLILGLGPVGLCLSVIAKHYGAAEIVAVEKSEYRRELAHKLGVNYVYETTPPSSQHSFDVIFEMSGNPDLIQLAFKCITAGGTLVAFGIPGDLIQINWGEAIINNEITIKSAFGRQIWSTWSEVQKIMLNPKIDLKPLITHRYSLKEIEEAIALMKSGKCGKVIISPEGV
ncbi:MAG: alcohol dehydrogenase catalytic domain-containing protein [bacterium]|nr:alcohol dehydrogenase catalytic domain-containing protein [bacterium]